MPSGSSIFLLSRIHVFFLTDYFLRIRFPTLRLSCIVERSIEGEPSAPSTYEKPKDDKDTDIEVEADVEKCSLTAATKKGSTKEQSKSEQMDPAIDTSKRRQSDEPIRRASLPAGSRGPNSSNLPKLSSSEILIIVFTSRMSLLILFLLLAQSMRAVSMISPEFGVLAFFSEKACFTTVAAVNFLITGYLYGYYPLELWDVFLNLMGTFWGGVCPPYSKCRRTSAMYIHPLGT